MREVPWTHGKIVRLVAPGVSLIAGAFVLQVALAWGGGGSCCYQCGCQDHIQKMCRVVCDVKEVRHTRYKVLCEDYCLSKIGHTSDCEYIPDCGHVRSRKKLVKFDEVEQVPVYKCVVEYLCPHCTQQYDAVPYVEPTKEVPVPHTAQLPKSLSRLVRPVEVPPVEMAPPTGQTLTR